MITKLQFKVTMSSKKLDELSDLMSKFDLGIDRIVIPIAYIVSMTTKTKVTKKYIESIKKLLKESVESSNFNLIGIERLI
jgi:hypothetical protein